LSIGRGGQLSLSQACLNRSRPRPQPH
jgi:hypothetical protein